MTSLTEQRIGRSDRTPVRVWVMPSGARIRWRTDGRIDGMSDDTSKRDYRDRDRINVHEDYEVQYWSKELGVTPEKLKQTVEKVGVMASDVRKALVVDLRRAGALALDG